MSEEKRAYPEWLRSREDDAVAQRRREVNLAFQASLQEARGEPDPRPQIEPNAPRLGLALSGGGIRSATFSLGVLQALSRSGLLPRVDYLSTVSGGGYIGSFLGALYARGESAKTVADTLTRFPESHELQWLRNNGRFLAPNGSGANWLAGAVLLRNWLSLLVVVAPLGFFLSFLGVLARALLHERLERAELSWLDALRVAYLPMGTLLVIPALCAVCWMMPCWLAYWMVNAGHRRSQRPAVSAAAVALVLVVPPALVYVSGRYVSGFSDDWLWPVAGFSGITAGAFFGAGWLRWRLQLQDFKEKSKQTSAQVHGQPQAESKGPCFAPFGPDSDNIARNKLSEWLKGGFMATVATLTVTLLDSLAFEVFARVRSGDLFATLQQLLALATGAGGVVLGTHRILAQFGSRKKAANASKVPVVFLIALAATVLIVFGVTVVSASAYGVAVPELGSQPDPARAALGIVASVLTMVLFGHFIVFVNQSSLGPIYNARLTRAYVGASNPNRKSNAPMKGRESPTEPIPGDQIAWDAYKPHQKGGPIHLINVTVNETVDPRVQLHQPDRKGMLMAVGPEGISLGVRHHAAWDGKTPRPDESVFQVFPTGKELTNAEKLPLGHWVAISGAAVATGLGQLGSFGTSLLCGVFNMRLGYWWSSNVSVKDRHHQAPAVSMAGSLMSVFGRFLPVYRLLAAEFLGRFPGTAIDTWYLTDGGHLENTGCYELIRRRVPFILCIDNGADPDAECSDLANLVRLARVDFGAEIEFFDRERLSTVLDPAAAAYFGSLQDLRREPPAPPTVYAGLARIRYPGGGSEHDRTSWLLLVKPRVLGSESIDVTAYGLAHATFPQQSTGDQSFDDAQWEAYRKLGDHVGTALFATKGERTADRWSPRWLDANALDFLNRVATPESQVRKKADTSADTAA